jgi:hypothetical protein
VKNRRVCVVCGAIGHWRRVTWGGQSSQGGRMMMRMGGYVIVGYCGAETRQARRKGC